MQKNCTILFKKIGGGDKIPGRGGIRYRKCPFGFVVKYSFKLNFLQLNLVDNVIIQVCNNIISNYMYIQV